MEYLQNKMAAYQLYGTGLTVAKDDEQLSLSTCEYSSTNGRLIVLAKRRCEDGKKRMRDMYVRLMLTMKALLQPRITSLIWKDIMQFLCVCNLNSEMD